MEIKTYCIKKQNHLVLILLSIVVMSTTFLKYFPDKVDTIIIFMPHFILIIYGILLCLMYQKKNYYPQMATKRLAIIITIFAVYYIFITGYRFASGGNAIQSLYTAIITFTSVILFFLIDAGIIERKNALTDLIIAVTLINILQIIIGWSKGSIRLSPVLQNIMVYDTVMLFMAPCFFYITQHLKELKLSKKWEILCWTNLLFSLVFITSSGSRSGMLIMAFSFVISMMINFKRKSKYLYKCFILYITAGIIMVFLYSFNIMDSRLGVTRNKLAFLNEPSNNIVTLEQPNEENDDAIKYEKFVKTSITSSDDVRGTLWDKSIKEIKKNPLLGTGTMLFEIEYFDGKLIQGSHNIILETSLAFGIIGMIFFFIMISIPIIYIILPIIKFKMRSEWRAIFSYILSISTIFMMSMVQPVLVMAFPVMLLWTMTGIVYRNTRFN